MCGDELFLEWLPDREFGRRSRRRVLTHHRERIRHRLSLQRRRFFLRCTLLWRSRHVFGVNSPEIRVGSDEFQFGVACFTFARPFHVSAYRFSARLLVAQKQRLSPRDFGLQIQNGAIVKRESGLGILGEEFAACPLGGLRALNRDRNLQRHSLCHSRRIRHVFLPCSLELNALVAALATAPFSLCCAPNTSSAIACRSWFANDITWEVGQLLAAM